MFVQIIIKLYFCYCSPKATLKIKRRLPEEHMPYSKSKNISVYLKVLPFLICCLFVTAASAQNDTLLVIKGQTSMKLRAKGLGLNSGVKGVDWKEEPLEGVEIEVKKNGVTILKTTSGKKGKYSFQIPVTTGDSKNDYTVYFSKDGMGPKMITVNAFLSKDEYKKHTFVKTEFGLDVPMIATTVKDIVIDKPFSKIKWDNVKEHKFSDQAYSKIAQSEEQKILANPDQYYTALLKKKKKIEETDAKKKAAAEAKLKAEEEAKKKLEEEARKKADEENRRLAALKAKEEADRIEREKAEALKKEKWKKHIADSLAEVQRKKALETASIKPETKEITKPVETYPEESKNLYDVSETYSINIARKSLSLEKEKRNREKGKNLTMKYETTNVLTSLLDVVDEFDKKNKSNGPSR